LLPRSCSLPQMAGGSASALSLSRPAQASLALQPTGSLSRPRRPLSRGSGPSGHPAEPLVSYQINRQFSGWIPPPLVIRAFGAHCQLPTSGEPPLTTAVEPSRSSSLSDGSCPHCGHCQEPVAGSQWGRHRGRQARLANPGIGVTSASRRRRSIDTFPPQEPRIPRALQSSVEPSRPPRCLRRCGNPRRFFARVAALNRRQAG
jgi:hypothetical protein